VVIYYLGPEGTFTHEAVILFCDILGFNDVKLEPVSTVLQVVDSVLYGAPEQKTAILGVVPLENSIQGSVTMSWDAVGRAVRERDTNFMSSFPNILASLTLAVDHRLLTLPSANIEEIAEVLSHPQALAQSQVWINQFLIDAKRIEVGSTAEAAQKVSEWRDPTKAAIGSKVAARKYGLVYSSTSVQSNSANRTRFGLIGSVPLVGTESEILGKWTLSILLVGLPNVPGGLFRALEPLQLHGFNLSRIETRPVGERLGEYFYFLDIQWNHAKTNPTIDKDWQEVLDVWDKHGTQVYQLGFFPELIRD